MSAATRQTPREVGANHEASLGTAITIATVLTLRSFGAIAMLGGMHVNVTGSLALFARTFQASGGAVQVRMGRTRLIASNPKSAERPFRASRSYDVLEWT
jgi:hypothetical protein